MKDISCIEIQCGHGLFKETNERTTFEIRDPKKISELLECFNVEMEYTLGCKCPNDDIIISFNSTERTYKFAIGITGDFQFSYIDERLGGELDGVDIEKVMSILKQYPEIVNFITQNEINI